MARLSLPAEYLAALTAKTRHPEAHVVVWHGDPPVALEITNDVLSLSVTITEEHRAGSAVLDVANPLGRYDPIGGRALADALAEDNKVEVFLGWNGSYHKAFTGKISGGRMRYQRGQAETIEVTCLDMGKRFWKQQITSTLYESLQANDIITALFTVYGEMEASDISLASMDFVIDKVQFIEENLMDAGLMCVQPKAYRLFFDYAGVLCSKITVAPDASSWDYDGREVEWLEYSWQDPTVNKVLVAGRTLDPVEIQGPEVKWGWMDNWVLPLTTHVKTFYKAFPPPSDTFGGTYAANRAVLTDSGGNSVGALWVSKEDRDGCWISAVSSKYQPFGFAYIGFDIYGKDTSLSTSVLMGSAKDDPLIAKYGEIIEEIENPLVQTTEDADFLAAATLRIALWYRYQPKLRVPCNLVHEPGDRITAFNPRTGQTHSLYIREITHRHARGTEASTELSCLLIT